MSLESSSVIIFRGRVKRSTPALLESWCYRKHHHHSHNSRPDYNKVHSTVRLIISCHRHIRCMSASIVHFPPLLALSYFFCALVKLKHFPCIRRCRIHMAEAKRKSAFIFIKHYITIWIFSFFFFFPVSVVRKSFAIAYSPVNFSLSAAVSRTPRSTLHHLPDTALWGQTHTYDIFCSPYYFFKT